MPVELPPDYSIEPFGNVWRAYKLESGIKHILQAKAGKFRFFQNEETAATYCWEHAYRHLMAHERPPAYHLPDGYQLKQIRRAAWQIWKFKDGQWQYLRNAEKKPVELKQDLAIRYAWKHAEKGLPAEEALPGMLWI